MTKPRTRPKLTIKSKIKLVALAMAGIKPCAIAAEMGVNNVTVYRYMKYHNIERRPYADRRAKL